MSSSLVKNFKLEIPGLENFNNNIQNIDLPGFTLGLAPQATPNRYINLIGGSIQYADLVVTSKMQENWDNFFEILEWCNQIRNLKEQPIDEFTKDINCIILDNNLKPIRTFVLLNCKPYDISPISLDYTVSDAEIIKFTVVFNYMRIKYSDEIKI